MPLLGETHTTTDISKNSLPIQTGNYVIKPSKRTPVVSAIRIWSGHGSQCRRSKSTHVALLITLTAAPPSITIPEILRSLIFIAKVEQCSSRMWGVEVGATRPTPVLGRRVNLSQNRSTGSRSQPRDNEMLQV